MANPVPFSAGGAVKPRPARPVASTADARSCADLKITHKRRRKAQPAVIVRWKRSTWGCILSGRLLMRTKAGDEIYEAGQAVYWAPGHVPVALEDTQYVDFSPTEEFNAVVDRIRSRG